MDINREYYRTFYQVVKTGSFTKAAKVLYSNQPNVTRTINKLEDSIGCPLFVRTKKGVLLTEEGKRLFFHVSNSERHILSAERELESLMSLDSGTVTIGATEVALELFLMKRLEDYKILYPNIKLHISYYTTYRAINMLSEGLIDMALVTTPINSAANINKHKVGEFHSVLIAGNNYKHLSDSRTSLSTLSSYPLIMYGSKTAAYQLYKELYASLDIPFNPQIEVATASQIISLVQYNLGLGFVPYDMALPMIQSEEVHAVALSEEIPSQKILLLTSEDRALSIASSTLFKMLT